ncbi:MAG TPA: SMC-Scp complex subunit ScpB [Clostridiaceae bacterium]|nr:SMC-Scp complex subunit ScpB [Clostridiaceae bacterium]
MELQEIESALESLLFAAGDRVPLDKLSEILEIDKKTLKLILQNMMDKFRNSNRGIIIREIDNGYQLCTNPENYDYVKKLFEPRHKQGLSQAAYEVLAIIAYMGPVTRAKIEQIRGVNSDSALARLLERNLIKETGRLDAPGKPVLYDTTEDFLRSFGFKSKNELPSLEGNEILLVQENLRENLNNINSEK